MSRELLEQAVEARAWVLAQNFHRVYEQLAPQFGYETRPETRGWVADSPNGKLMRAVCAELIRSGVLQAALQQQEAPSGQERMPMELADYTQQQVDELSHNEIAGRLRLYSHPLLQSAADSIAYLAAQEGLLEKAQQAAERARAELAETKRPLDEPMARLNQRVIELTAELDALRLKLPRPQSLLRPALKPGERLVCYCPPGICQAPKGFSGPCNRATDAAASPSAPDAPSGPGYTWPPKACPCGDIQSFECQETDCRWTLNPQLVPLVLRRAAASPSEVRGESLTPEELKYVSAYLEEWGCFAEPLVLRLLQVAGASREGVKP